METKSTMSLSDTQVNPDLVKERRNSSLNETGRREITYLRDGAPKSTAKRRAIESIVFREPCMDMNKTYYQGDVEYHDGAVERAVTILRLMNIHKWSTEEMDVAMDLIRGDMALFVHMTMFVPALERLATDELRKKWLPLAKTCRIFGTYAQTELGHGTNLSKLETEALYDQNSQEFVMNTPRLTSMKWWPGGLGKSTTHALVLAQLCSRGKRCGLHAFLVQIRSLQHHQPMPGVTVGTIGPKFGGRGAENGYLILNRVRIPRTNMLMKYAEVSADGVFKRLGRDKATYGTMVLVRTKITNWAFHILSQSVTIALRYSAVRHQSQLKPGAPESAILDYQTQQYKLFPLLALSYALMFAKNSMLDIYRKSNERMGSGDFSTLPELHCLSSGLKAFSSDLAVQGVEMCRRSCGGHGYLNASGLPKILCDGTSAVTIEGDNTVLYLQTARFLLKTMLQPEGDSVLGTTDFLQRDDTSIQGDFDCYCGATLTRMYEQRAKIVLSDVVSKFQEALMNGQEQYLVWNQCAAPLVKAAKAFIHCFVVCNFKTSLDSLAVSTPTLTALRQLFLLNAFHGIVDNAGEFLETGALTFGQLKLIKEEELKLLTAIRPNAIALVDAFDYSDEVLCSALGSYDGNVYQRLFEATKLDPLNEHQVAPTYEKYLKPLLKSQSKL
ncbi:peroxisomal acyl-coenzyme A oxidase 1-like [Lineus longissimus]|uniref:peroxisomal acyl-coenzyme A oxidase 1-like n=1 Tax=Lineus longissimus TaxID=88925 RepID=UPI002B4D3CCD